MSLALLVKFPHTKENTFSQMREIISSWKKISIERAEFEGALCKVSAEITEVAI